jgi:hypothetical protein
MKKKEIKKICKSTSLKPMEGYHEPVYPVKETFATSRGLLQDCVPSSWLKTGISATALIVLALSTHPVLAVDSIENKDRIVCNDDENPDRETIPEEKSAIAPLFIHGDGFGASGCSVVSPPIFLSEADAYEVIAAALEKEGIVFDKRDYLREDIYSVDDLFKQYFESKDIYDAQSAEKIPFHFDFYSSEYNLGIKFISRDNHDDFAEVRSLAQDKKELRVVKRDPHIVMGTAPRIQSTVYSYNMIEASQRIRECLRGSGNINAVLFYDPMVNAKDDNVLIGRNDREKTRLLDNARQLLTQQVEDFGRWFRQTFKKSDEKETRQ